MSAPRTVAGRALLARYPIRLRREGSAEHNAELHDAILAIEADASAELRVALERLANHCTEPSEARAAARAALATPAPATPLRHPEGYRR